MNILFNLLIISTLSGSAAASSGQSQQTNKTLPNAEQNTPMQVGGEKDSHGCIAAAGYTWSVTKKKCVRVWEDKDLELLPTNSKETSFTAVMFNAKKDTAEVFLPTKSIFLKAKGKNTWVGSGYKLSTTAKGSQLSKGNKVLYKSK